MPFTCLKVWLESKSSVHRLLWWLCAIGAFCNGRYVSGKLPKAGALRGAEGAVPAWMLAVLEECLAWMAPAQMPVFPQDGLLLYSGA